MQPIILAIAPHPKAGIRYAFDFSPESVARSVIEAARLGASVVHLHMLDEKGNETSDPAVFNETIRLIRESCDIIIQGSTGGSTELALEDRCLTLRNEVLQMASLNMGSVNFGEQVYQNPYPSILYFAREMERKGVIAELEIFDLSMLYVAKDMIIKRLCRPIYNFCFDFPNALPAKPSILKFMLSELNERESVSILQHGMPNLDFLASSLDEGVTGLRVGLEDSVYDAHGKAVYENVLLFSDLAEMVRQKGYQAASVREAKEILHIQK